ncbi:MAG: class I SAM-dependent methyltransferase [Sneathiella sp.]|nr:class I SAM-dependent methyltransferase [Sneathiella sp.]
MGKLKKVVKNQISRFISILCPSLVREIETATNPSRHAWLKKQIIDGDIARATKSNDFDELQKAHFQYWQGNEGAKFYDAYPERFDEWFLGEHFVLVQELQKLIQSNKELKTLVEIGCGNGKVLNYLSSNLSGIERSIGIDINDEVIQADRGNYSDKPKLEFASGDAREWIIQNLESGSVLLSYGGVLEYFSEQLLREVFQILKQGPKPVAIALVEPISPEHDLHETKHSLPFGVENSFSHNHEYLLKSAGFEIMFECERQNHIRWKIIIATAA